MLVAVAFLLGGFGTIVAWRATRPVFAAELFLRENYRGRQVPVAVGLLIPLVAIGADAVFAVLAALDVEGTGIGERALVLAAALGFGLLGAFDDLAGGGSERGFAGHLRAMVGGRLTTGGLKLLGGGLLAVALAGTVDGDRFDRLAVDALLIAGAANLGNLLDRAPGRTTKVGLVAFAVLLVVVGLEESLVGVAVVAGASAGLLLPDLGEELMLGDAGANVVGAAVGLGVVLATSPGTRAGVLVGVAALNVASELVSFSAVIERVPPLRALDRLGRRP